MTTSAAVAAWRGDRSFYAGMALAMATTVCGGFAAAFHLRARSQTHKRFMPLATISILEAAIAASQPLRLMICGTPAWLAFADRLLR